jgi:hypothetical protein
VKKEVRSLGEQTVVRHLNSSRGNGNGLIKGKVNLKGKFEHLKNMREIYFKEI